MRTYGIVLLPDKKTEASIRVLSKKERGNQIRFGPKAQVHLSLLHIVLRPKQMTAVKRAFLTLVLPKPLSLTCTGTLRQKSGWCFVETRKTKALAGLQRKVLPLTKMRAKGTPFTWQEHASQIQKRSYIKYGYPNVGAAWQAHFTFAKTDPQPDGTFKPMTKKVRLERIALVEIGKDYGTAGKILCLRSL